MISALKGEVLSRGSDWLIVLVAGVGYRVEVPSAFAAASYQGDEVFLHTQLVPREDSLTLFGFQTEEELSVFKILLTVNGVGPRTALGILNTLSPQQLAAAVAAEDDKPFKAVSGIGPKTAKLIVVSLAGKLAGIVAAEEPAAAQAAGSTPEVASQVIIGLVGLGYSEADAAQAVADAAGAGVDADSAQLLRAALKLLQTPKLKQGQR